MKGFLKFFATVSAMLVGVVAVIKYVQGCSWRDAVGILEEFVAELRENCPCCRSACDDAAVAEAETAEQA